MQFLDITNVLTALVKLKICTCVKPYRESPIYSVN